MKKNGSGRSVKSFVEEVDDLKEWQRCPIRFRKYSFRRGRPSASPRKPAKKKSKNPLRNIDAVIDLSSDSSADEAESSALDRLLKRSKQQTDPKSSIGESIQSSSDYDEKPLPKVSSKKRNTRRKAGNRTRSVREKQQKSQVEVIQLSSDDEYAISGNKKECGNDEVIEQRCAFEIEDIEGCTDFITWKMNDKLEGIAQKYAQKWKCDEHLVTLINKKDSSKIRSDQTPSQLHFKASEHVILFATKISQPIDPSDDPNYIQVFLQSAGHKIPKWIHKKKPLVDQLDDAIDELEMQRSTVKFSCDGETIGRNDTSESLDLFDGEIIDVTC